MKTEHVTLNVSDETQMKAFVAYPESSNQAPGIIVFQEIFGVNAHIRDVTERFAKAGFLAIAPELFHRSAPGFESGYVDMKPGSEQAKKMTRAGIEADALASHNWLRQHGVAADRVSAVGYCRGGYVTFLANSKIPLRSAISYYGGGIDTILDAATGQNGPILFFWGGRDPHITPELRDKVVLRDARGKERVHQRGILGADHGFFCDQRASYNEKAAKESWALSLQFLQR